MLHFSDVKLRAGDDALLKSGARFQQAQPSRSPLCRTAGAHLWLTPRASWQWQQVSVPSPSSPVTQPSASLLSARTRVQPSANSHREQAAGCKSNVTLQQSTSEVMRPCSARQATNPRSKSPAMRKNNGFMPEGNLSLATTPRTPAMVAGSPQSLSATSPPAMVAGCPQSLSATSHMASRRKSPFSLSASHPVRQSSQEQEKKGSASLSPVRKSSTERRKEYRSLNADSLLKMSQSLPVHASPHRHNEVMCGPGKDSAPWSTQWARTVASHPAEMSSHPSIFGTEFKALVPNLKSQLSMTLSSSRKKPMSVLAPAGCLEPKSSNTPSVVRSKSSPSSNSALSVHSHGPIPQPQPSLNVAHDQHEWPALNEKLLKRDGNSCRADAGMVTTQGALAVTSGISCDEAECVKVIDDKSTISDDEETDLSDDSDEDCRSFKSSTVKGDTPSDDSRGESIGGDSTPDASDVATPETPPNEESDVSESIDFCFSQLALAQERVGCEHAPGTSTCSASTQDSGVIQSLMRSKESEGTSTLGDISTSSGGAFLPGHESSDSDITVPQSLCDSELDTISRPGDGCLATALCRPSKTGKSPLMLEELPQEKILLGEEKHAELLSFQADEPEDDGAKGKAGVSSDAQTTQIEDIPRCAEYSSSSCEDLLDDQTLGSSSRNMGSDDVDMQSIEADNESCYPIVHPYEESIPIEETLLFKLCALESVIHLRIVVPPGVGPDRRVTIERFRRSYIAQVPSYAVAGQTVDVFVEKRGPLSLRERDRVLQSLRAPPRFQKCIGHTSRISDVDFDRWLRNQDAISEICNLIKERQPERLAQYRQCQGKSMDHVLEPIGEDVDTINLGISGDIQMICGS